MTVNPMVNPFVYGEAVTGDNFCNRTEEIKKLKLDILNCQKIFLISSRKLGKTSLLKTILGELDKKSVISVFIDIEGLVSYKEFLDTYLLALLKKSTPLERIIFFLREILPGIRIDFSISESGKPTLTLGYGPADPQLTRIAAKIYSLPEIIQKRRKKRVVIMFDEFQEILKLNGKNIESALRASIQQQRNVAYIFAGSKQHLLENMISSPARPFYKIGPVMHLKKIPEDTFVKFIKDKFYRTKFKISYETVNRIIKFTENIPYYTQMFCHELWDYGLVKREIKSKDIEIVLNQLIEQHSQDFHLIWSRLIVSKRQLLKAIATSGGRNILSKEFLTKHNLGLPSSTRQTLVSLVEETYLDRENDEYYFTDLLFREWIKKQAVD